MVTEKRTAPTLKERRLATLRRTGVADRHRVALEKPSAAFFWILIIVISFVMLGLVMVLSSSSVTNLHSGSSAWAMFERQLVWAALGAVAMWAAYEFPYETWRKKFLLQFVSVLHDHHDLHTPRRACVAVSANHWPPLPLPELV